MIHCWPMQTPNTGILPEKWEMASGEIPESVWGIHQSRRSRSEEVGRTLRVGRGQTCYPDAKRETLEELVEHDRDNQRGCTVVSMVKTPTGKCNVLNSDPVVMDRVKPMTRE